MVNKLKKKIYIFSIYNFIYFNYLICLIFIIGTVYCAVPLVCDLFCIGLVGKLLVSLFCTLSTFVVALISHGINLHEFILSNFNINDNDKIIYSYIYNVFNYINYLNCKKILVIILLIGNSLFFTFGGYCAVFQLLIYANLQTSYPLCLFLLLFASINYAHVFILNGSSLYTKLMDLLNIPEQTDSINYAQSAIFDLKDLKYDQIIDMLMREYIVNLQVISVEHIENIRELTASFYSSQSKSPSK